MMTTAPPTSIIEVPRPVHEAMIRHALGELPNEACGLLAGPDGRIERYWPMRNADRSPTTYRLEPNEQLSVFDEIDALGWELKAIFHSHPHTEAKPSPTDREQAFYPDAFYLLVSLEDRGRPVLRGFTIRGDHVREHEVRIV